MATELRWSEFASYLPYEARTVLTATLHRGLGHAQVATALTCDDNDVVLIAEHLDAALEYLAQARELLTLALHLVCERDDALSTDLDPARDTAPPSGT